MKYFISFILLLLMNSTVIQAADYKTQLKDFVVQHALLHFEEEDYQKVSEEAKKVSNDFKFAKSVGFYDINSDAVPEIFLEMESSLGNICEVYKLADGEYLKIGQLDAKYGLFTNPDREIKVLEGAPDDFIRYSALTVKDEKLLKNSLYYEGNEYFNYIGDAKQGDSIFVDIKLIDKYAYPLNEMSFKTEMSWAKDQLTSEYKLDAKIPNTNIIINNILVPAHTKPIIVDNRTLVPVRTIAENFGAEVLWDDAEREVKINLNDENLTFKINSKTAYLNGNPITMDTMPIIREDRVLLPMRFIVETLHGTVAWNNSTRTVLIMYNEKAENPKNLDFELYGTPYDKALLGKFKEITEVLIDKDSEQNMFWINSSVTNLSVHELDWKEGHDLESISIKKTIDKFSPQDMLIIDAIVPEGTPKTGISYTCSNGEEMKYVVSYNGRFGGIGLVPMDFK